MTVIEVKALIGLEIGGVHRSAAIPVGGTLLDAVEAALPDLAERYYPSVRVSIDGERVSHEVWRAVRPALGTTVWIWLGPEDVGDVLSTALGIASQIAGLYLGQTFGAHLGSLLGLGGQFGATVGSLLIQAGVTIGANLLLDLLIPQKRVESAEAPKPLHQTIGWQNRPGLNGPVPILLGRKRIAPVYAALPYVEIVGNDQYVTVLMAVSIGRKNLSDHRFGETPVSSFDDVWVEVQRPADATNAADAAQTLYRQQVVQLPVAPSGSGGVEVIPDLEGESAIPVIRRGPRDVSKSILIFTFPQGLFALNKKGKRRTATAVIKIEERVTGTTDWVEVETISMTDETQDPFSRSYERVHTARGQWDFRVTNMSGDPGDKNFRRIEWWLLQGVRPEHPINTTLPITYVAIRARSSRQLNGIIDQYNVLAQSVEVDWDSGTSSWVAARETRSIPSLIRGLLQGPAHAYPLADAKLALPEFQELAAHCVANNLYFDHYYTDQKNIWAMVAEIAAAGRASLIDRGTQWGFAIDNVRPKVRCHITPRNSWGFEQERTRAKIEDAYYVAFDDEAANYFSAERVVPRPGLAGPANIKAAIQMIGVTDAAAIYTAVRRRFRELQYRNRRYYVMQRRQSLECARMDRVMLWAPQITKPVVTARVLATRGGLIEIDEPFTAEAGKTYSAVFMIEASGDLESYTRPITPLAVGTHRAFTIPYDGPLPTEGIEICIGESTNTGRDCLVAGIEIQDGPDILARLTLMDYAPQIDTEQAADTPPAFTNIIGQASDLSGVGPGIPVIVSVISGEEAQSETGDANKILVTLAPDPAPGVLPARYDVRHRLTGAPSFDPSISTGDGNNRAEISGYAEAQAVEIQARGVSAYGVAGNWTASTFHTVAAPALDASVLTFTASRTSGVWSFAWTVNPDLEGLVNGYRIAFRLYAWNAWADLTVMHTSILTGAAWATVSGPQDNAVFTFAILADRNDGLTAAPVFFYCAAGLNGRPVQDASGGLLRDSNNDFILTGV